MPHRSHIDLSHLNKNNQRDGIASPLATGLSVPCSPIRAVGGQSALRQELPPHRGDTTFGYLPANPIRQVDSPGIAEWQITNFYTLRYTCDNAISG
jgi:hypothetical protein